MPSTDYLHPEFGYFGPGPRLRRDFKVACFSLLAGVMAGAVVVGALGARDDREADAAALQPAMSGAPSQAAAADAAPSFPAAAISQPARAVGADAPAIAAPRMRFVRTGNAAKGGAGKPGMASAEIATDGRGEKAGSVAAAPARLADVSPSPTAVPAQPAENPAPRAAAVAKKKTARAPARRRNDADVEYSWRDERLDHWYGRGYAGYARGGFGREGPYARGFWGW